MLVGYYYYYYYYYYFIHKCLSSFFGPHRYQLKKFQKKKEIRVINFIVKIMPWITNLFGLKKKKKTPIYYA
jgi:hypothetical protein